MMGKPVGVPEHVGCCVPGDMQGVERRVRRAAGPFTRYLGSPSRVVAPGIVARAASGIYVDRLPARSRPLGSLSLMISAIPMKPPQGSRA